MIVRLGLPVHLFPRLPWENSLENAQPAEFGELHLQLSEGLGARHVQHGGAGLALLLLFHHGCEVEIEVEVEVEVVVEVVVVVVIALLLLVVVMTHTHTLALTSSAALSSFSLSQFAQPGLPPLCLSSSAANTQPRSPRLASSSPAR